MAGLLGYVESLASEKESGYSRSPLDPLVITWMHHTAARELRAHTLAFDKGFISCQRVLEVLVEPFIKLGKKAIEAEGTGSADLLDTPINSWFHGITAALIGDVVQESYGVGRVDLVLRHDKRLELVNALLKSKLVEVSLRLILTLVCTGGHSIIFSSICSSFCLDLFC